eukprot:TRINITY_DN7497_c0_g2_i1.p1 TRINITY_DN7497_c0_g2~~TRINITY_DN7497_c0_g2_i1.p1  ORF type:complete len:551 (-),score=213.66 TRINITY_DN7497_c0_g2_i1:35-1687(-)
MNKNLETVEMQAQLRVALDRLSELLRQQEKLLKSQGIRFEWDSQLLGEENPSTHRIQEFLEILKQKYLGLAERLKEEQERRTTSEMENIGLKSKLASELEKHEQLVQNAKAELNQLVETNKKVIEEMELEEQARELVEKQLADKERIVETLNSSIKLQMEKLIREKERRRLLEIRARQLDSELSAVRDTFNGERRKGEELEKGFKSMEAEYQSTFKRMKTLGTKHEASKSALEKAMAERFRLEEERRTKVEEMELNIRKLESLKRRLEELEETYRRLTSEIALKNEEMARLRKENGEMESRLKSLATLETELERATTLKEKLAVENEILCHQIRCVDPDFDLSQYSFKAVMSAGEEGAESQAEVNVTDPNLLCVDSANEDPEGEQGVLRATMHDVDDIKSLRKEIDMRRTRDGKKDLEIEMLEREIEAKDNDLEERDARLKELNAEISNLNKELENVVGEKHRLGKECDEVQQKMDVLSNLYEDIAKDLLTEEAQRSPLKESNKRDKKVTFSEERELPIDVEALLRAQPRRITSKTVSYTHLTLPTIYSV